MTQAEQKNKAFELIEDESFRSMVVKIAKKMGMTPEEWKEMRLEMYMRFALLMTDMEDYEKGLA